MEPDILPLALRRSGLLTISAKVLSPGAGGCRAARSNLPAPQASCGQHLHPALLPACLALGSWLKCYPEAPNFCSGLGAGRRDPRCLLQLLEGLWLQLPAPGVSVSAKGLFSTPGSDTKRSPCTTHLGPNICSLRCRGI